MSIYIALHKKVEIPKIEGYIPIQVGASNNEKIGYLCDDNGENISAKNPNYCELTALYWMWKNSQEASCIGLVHYRRYFVTAKTIFNNGNILALSECENILKINDIILPEKWYFKNTVKEHYERFHNVEDLMQCRIIIEKDYPDYIDAFDEVMDRKFLHLFNMFVMNREKFNDYMEWLFHILFKLEKEIDITRYDDYNKRVYGFLSERLFNVWILKNNLSVKTLPVLNTESTAKNRILFEIKNTIKRLMCKF